MEKVGCIFLMDLFSRDGLIRVKLKDKITFLFILMVLFTEVLLVILKKMDLENFPIIMDFNIKDLGKMINPMV